MSWFFWVFAIFEVVFFLSFFRCGMAVVCKSVFTCIHVCGHTGKQFHRHVERPELDTDFRILCQSLFHLDGPLKLRVSPAMLTSLTSLL